MLPPRIQSMVGMCPKQESRSVAKILVTVELSVIWIGLDIGCMPFPSRHILGLLWSTTMNKTSSVLPSLGHQRWDAGSLSQAKPDSHGGLLEQQGHLRSSRTCFKEAEALRQHEGGRYGQSVLLLLPLPRLALAPLHPKNRFAGPSDTGSFIGFTGAFSTWSKQHLGTKQHLDTHLDSTWSKHTCVFLWKPHHKQHVVHKRMSVMGACGELWLSHSRGGGVNMEKEPSPCWQQ